MQLLANMFQPEGLDLLFREVSQRGRGTFFEQRWLVCQTLIPRLTTKNVHGTIVHKEYGYGG